MRDLSGMTAEGVEASDVEREMAQGIRRFEPRVLPKSVSVKAAVARGRLLAARDPVTVPPYHGRSQRLGSTDPCGDP